VLSRRIGHRRLEHQALLLIDDLDQLVGALDIDAVVVVANERIRVRRLVSLPGNAQRPRRVAIKTPPSVVNDLRV